jgi:hypothetical protein
MPRITKAQLKESIAPFAIDAITVINRKVNVNDLINREDIPDFEQNGWYYYVHKSIINNTPEIRIKRQNYRLWNTQYYKDQPKGNRISEEAWIYLENMNCNANRIDTGYIVDGFSIQNYIKKAF